MYYYTNFIITKNNEITKFKNYLFLKEFSFNGCMNHHYKSGIIQLKTLSLDKIRTTLVPALRSMGARLFTFAHMDGYWEFRKLFIIIIQPVYTEGHLIHKPSSYVKLSRETACCPLSVSAWFKVNHNLL